MSEENVDVVRRAFEALYRRPDPDFDTVNVLFHPDHELISRIEALEGGSRRGVRGYREWLSDVGETVDWESTLESVRQIDDDRVLAVMPTSFTGRQSGIALDSQRLATIVTVRDGQIVRSEVHTSPDEALEAAGLSE
jgi:ketosteroid isomerase-like protein